jgi:hypothetical protein
MRWSDRPKAHESAPHPARRGVSVALAAAITMLGAIFALGPPSATGPSHRGASPALFTAQDGPHAIVPPNEPPANVTPPVPVNCDLFALDGTSDCMFSALLDINYARALEGVGPMILPADYTDMAPSQQLFVIFNLERTGRGLPPFIELDASADNDALIGALGSDDPPLQGSSTFQPGGGIAAFEVGNALQADWEWMYTDGCYPYEGSANCTSESPTDPGGWGHRSLILGNDGGSPVAGAAEATATSGRFAGQPIWTAEFGQPLAAVPNGDTAFLNSSVTYPSGAAPDIVRLTPSTGGPGSHITIQGVYLSGASAVYFGGPGCVAAPAVTSDESAAVVVPGCASGTVGVQIVVPPNISNAVSFNPQGPVVGAASGTGPAPFVGMAVTPSGNGYWEVGADGGVFTYGFAGFHGSMGGRPLNAPIVAMAATPDGNGYWLVGGDGGVFAFGSAGFYGSAGNLRLTRPIVGMASTADGGGYWLVASDGGVFAYGDARFQGSMGGTPLNRPVVGMAADPATGGYWLVASDGGVFSFDAPFYGSTGNIRLTQPVVGMEAAPDGSGYRFVASDGGVFTFRLPFEGSEGSVALDQPVVGMAAQGATGYWMVARDGGVFTFGGAGFFGSGA